ncbi:GNAT family N-acetyltransferase [Frondihabitans australicus]|uniref:RimJ/RimL family protein N-acetyltransferase n=1 Tax=Frondihabitans australicus TaxID=386892 RepID=A0A495II26_9MICO|nr:GNAT family protein [Frondihabitans australicus]RKR75633.1 RimJ/RimL family protein N-acetyltransferase [Frondihabitans australicus]
MSDSATLFSSTPTLEGPRVRLEGLAAAHEADLAEAVAVGDLWQTWYTSIPSPDGMAAAIRQRLDWQGAGLMAPWAVVSQESGKAVGMTTFCNLVPETRRLEIGYTWLGRGVQRTGVNAQAKLLLLTRAFDELDCIAVEFRTHWHNVQSRAAIARLGAKQDGVLRNHQIGRDGTLRDTVVFSITASEWPTVRLSLTERLARRA